MSKQPTEPADHSGTGAALGPEAALPELLRRAAAQVIIDYGLAGFSLREVARRANVSHAAPGYHFGDARGLLTALAVEGFRRIYDATAAAAAQALSPEERLVSIGTAYVRTAIAYPAHCEVLFRPDLIDVNSVEVETAGIAAFGVLRAAVQELADAHDPTLDVHEASKLCWSAMQGLVQLHHKLARLDLSDGREPAGLEASVEAFTLLLISGLVRHAPGSTRRRRR